MEILTAITKAKGAVASAKTNAHKITAASKLTKAMNMTTSERTIKKLKIGIEKAGPLLTIITDTELATSVFQGCSVVGMHADAAAMVIFCLNVLLTVRSDRATISNDFVPQEYCDITDEQLRSAIMVGGWGIREARILLFTKYKNDPDQKKILYAVIGALTMAFDINLVTPAEDDESNEDSNDDMSSDVSDNIPLFLKIYNEGGLTYPTIAVRAWVYGFFQYIDECFRRLSKSTYQPPKNTKDFEEGIVIICRNSSQGDDPISIGVFTDISKIMVSKLTNARNGMLLRHYVGNQNILAAEKVHIRQQLAAYSIVGREKKQSIPSERQHGTTSERGDATGMKDDLQYFQPFNEAEDYYLRDIAQYNDDNDNVLTQQLDFTV